MIRFKKWGTQAIDTMCLNACGIIHPTSSLLESGTVVANGINTTCLTRVQSPEYAAPDLLSLSFRPTLSNRGREFGGNFFWVLFRSFVLVLSNNLFGIAE